jgi:hypothetical protein
MLSYQPVLQVDKQMVIARREIKAVKEGGKKLPAKMPY